MIYLSIDIETTGLNPERCQVLQVGGYLEDAANPKPREETPSFCFLLDHPSTVGDPYALSMNAWILNELVGFRKLSSYQRAEYNQSSPHPVLSPDVCWSELEKFLDRNLPDKHGNRIVAAGKNFGSFDLQFISRLPGYGARYTFYARSLDPSIF